MFKFAKTAQTLFALSTLLGAAYAAPMLSAKSIIVNPIPAEITAKLWLDRDPSGISIPKYQPGQQAKISVLVNKDSYVYVFNVDPAGTVDMIVPNRFTGEAAFVKGNSVRTFPASGEAYTLDIAQPYGVNKVLVIASLKPLNMTEIASFKNTQDVFATVAPSIQGQGRLAQALSIVVNPVQKPIPQSSWNAASVWYNVAR